MNYTKLRKEDIIKMMNDLQSQSSSKREFVCYTGERGMLVFDLAMKGIYLPHFNYHLYLPKKLHNIIYLSIGRKESNLKVLIKVREKEYIILQGTKEISRHTSIEFLNSKLYKLINENKS